MDRFKKSELPTIEICKVGCFNGEAWLADDVQAGRSFQARLGKGKALPYVSGLLQWGKVHPRDTSFIGGYYIPDPCHSMNIIYNWKIH